jgi:hypothetical protein
MPRKNLLSLHEAVIVALINQRERTMTIEQISNFITKRSLYPERKGNVTLATQIMLRTTKSNGTYEMLFEQIDDNTIRLRNFDYESKGTNLFKQKP